jgi:hypothetical protein
MEEEKCDKDLQIKAVCSLVSNWSNDEKRKLFEAMLSNSSIFCINNTSSLSLSKIEKFTDKQSTFYEWMGRNFFPKMSNVFTHEDFDMALKYYDFFVSEALYFERIDVEIHVSKRIRSDLFNAQFWDKWDDILDQYSPHEIFIRSSWFIMSFYSFVCNVRKMDRGNVDIDLLLYLLDFKEETQEIHQRLEEIIGGPFPFKALWGTSAVMLEKYFEGLKAVVD